MFEAGIALLAGLGAGITTGLVGASAVVIAAPLFIVFLGYPTYLAIGIALSIDVFSSVAATFIYQKHKRIRIRPALILLISSLIAVIVGSYASLDISSKVLGGFTGLGITGIGIAIALKNDSAISAIQNFSFLKKHKKIFLALAGLWIGGVAGVFGGGGGIMILSVLVLLLDYEIHEAIGTSVLMMIFIASLGGFTHYINMEFAASAFIISNIGGIAGALGSAKLANKMNENLLTKLVGSVIAALGLILMATKILSF